MESVEFLDLQPEMSDFLSDVIAGLSGSQKSIPPKYFYDQKGSELFDQICDLEEYYPTRTEVSILANNAELINQLLPDKCTMFEYGSGSSVKIRKLLELSTKIDTYIPIDISAEHLLSAADRIQTEFRHLKVKAVCADYTEDNLIEQSFLMNSEKVVFFPGSTIGNLLPAESLDLLKMTHRLLGEGGLMILGIDLIKQRDMLLAAYDDGLGVTAAFNKNLLHRVNRELEANFDVSRFAHEARFNQELSRMEMHLVSSCDQEVMIGNSSFNFQSGESIHTENSHKYSIDSFLAFAKNAGFKEKQVFTDKSNLFAVVVLEATD